MKLRRIISLLVLICIVIIGVNQYIHALNTKNQRIAILEIKKLNYEKKLITCLDISNYFPYVYENNPRSEERLQEISESFDRITNAPCFSKGDGKMYKNHYSSIELQEISQNSSNKLEVEMYRGILYEFDKGVPFLRSGMTLCEDGYISYSRGSGSCSWHGGYANQRGDFFTFGGKTLMKDPRIELAELKGE